jgi:Superinfection immunity protein/Short C-terminal domain
VEIVPLLLLLALYFTPSIGAMIRKHHNVGAIFALNLFGGWTLVGWVVAVVWACTETKKKEVTGKHVDAMEPDLTAEVSDNERISKLVKLQELKEKGAITNEEFLKMKSEVMNSCYVQADYSDTVVVDPVLASLDKRSTD